MEDGKLKEIAIATIQRLEPADFVYTVDEWDIYNFPGTGTGTIALRIEKHDGQERLQIKLFVPMTLTLEEIREALKEEISLLN